MPARGKRGRQKEPRRRLAADERGDTIVVERDLWVRTRDSVGSRPTFAARLENRVFVDRARPSHVVRPVIP
jgi:hypothetical protein